MIMLLGYTPIHRNSVSRRIVHLYHEHFKALVQELKSIDSVSITADFWTDRNCRSFLVITGHYCTNDFQLKSKVLSFSQFFHRHTSEKIASYLNAKLKALDIERKVNRIVTDGANNIKHAIELLDIDAKRLWCVAHRLHLVIINGLGLWSKMTNQTIKSSGIR